MSKSPSRRDSAALLFDKLLQSPPPLLAATAFVAGSTATLIVSVVRKRYFRRFSTSEWITPDVLRRKRWIKGVVTSVGDADNFRIYHTPGWGWRWPLKFRWVPSAAKDLKDQTLHIRMAGVDAPEAAHFGRPAQVYSAEALAWLKEQVDGKLLYCQLLFRDQYGRIIAIPMLPSKLLPKFLAPWTGKCLSLEMLRAGWATTYEQSNAEYGKWGKEEFLRIEAEAKATKRGQWKHGVTAETPAEYKRRYSQAGQSPKAVEDAGKAAELSPSPKSWFGWLWPRR